MTLSLTLPTITVEGNGTATSFSYPFEIPSAADAVVIFTDATGAQTTIPPDQFAISGLGHANGGAVIYPLAGSPIASGTLLTIQRILPLVQTTAVSYDGPAFGSLESELDYQMMVIQQLNYTLGRTIQLNVADINPVPQLPPAAQRAGNFLNFDANGNPTVINFVSGGVPVSAAMQPVVGANSVSSALSLLSSGQFTVTLPPGTPFAPGDDGNNWANACGLFQVNQAAAHSSPNDARSAMSVVYTANGSGITGPTNADVGLFVSAAKNNYLTSPTDGEVDSLYIFNRQGQSGDAAGILVDASRVDGGTTNPDHGQLAFEWQSSLVSPTTGIVTSRMHGTVGYTLTGSTTSERYGYTAEAWQGPSKAAYVVDTFNDGGVTPQWEWAFLYRQLRQDAGRLFGVDGAGRIMLGTATTSRPLYTNAITGSVVMRNVADNADLQQLGNDGSAVLGNVDPLADNVYALGASGTRYTSVWAVNGTIQTSDPEQKTDIQAVPSVMTVIDKVHPVTFRWKIGGYDLASKDDPSSVKARPGKRLHWGFSAPEVKAAFDDIGMDFGGYVKAEDGSHALRPDQLIPVLWKAVQELSAEVAALKGK